MQDRVPLYPGRVKLTPISGQENTYDMVRADEPTQEGTQLNKATLLKDSTAALFGLDENAVPDDALVSLYGLYHDAFSAKLLWENASPKSAFYPQTITVDGDPYDSFIVEIRVGTVRLDANQYPVNKIDGDIWFWNSGAVLEGGSYQPSSGARFMKISGNSFVFQNAVYWSVNYSGAKEDNTVQIPYRIYGIKGVKAV